MNNAFYRWIAGLLLAFAIVACGKDQTETAADTGVSKQTWKADNGSLSAGQSLTYSFVAARGWTAESSDPSWCTVPIESGPSGINILKVSTRQNTTGDRRTATITIRVSGYASPAKFRIVQNARDGDYQEVNKWMYSYLHSNYLWNKALDNVTIDYSQNYSAFLNSILVGVAAQKDADGRDVNYDDGFWKNGERRYFYSYVSGPAISPFSQTRAGDVMTDTGLWRVRAVSLTNADQTVSVLGFSVYGVVPGTSAATAGLRRGMFISSVDGQTPTQSNYLILQEKLYYGTSVKLTPNEVVWDSSGKFQSLDPLPEVTVSASTYIDPAIYKAAVSDVGGKKVAYLLYMGFEMEDDPALIAAFDEFKRQKATELILDLRSNGGGSVRSSTVLGTLIAGSRYKDVVYARLTYNADRTARKEEGFYKIGSEAVPDGQGTYPPIAAALNSALALDRIFVLCTESTASSSELVINGLRGLDIGVNLIGTQTNGKNVGMEGYSDREIGGVSYTFMPITFYSENAKGFRDYSEGFVPDVVFEDKYFPGDFGTTDDPLYSRAARWIRTGQKPASAALPTTRSETGMRLFDEGPGRPDRHSKGSLVFLDE